ncbi:MAG: hypothetical protein WC326_01785 [Candidatus Delongbacteria bacterium]
MNKNEGKPTPAAAAPDPAPAAIPSVQQRVETVLKKLKLPEPVVAGVLAEHGLTRTALVDPAEFQAQVTAWLAAPAQK